MLKKAIVITLSLIVIAIIAIPLLWRHSSSGVSPDDSLIAKVERRTVQVDVSCVGELEAARSTHVTSTLNGDIKIISLATDGITVNKGDLLAKIDPAPFEEKLTTLNLKLKEQEYAVISCENTLTLDIRQSKHEKVNANFDVEAAELELTKIRDGDGPLEIARLKAAMQKAEAAYQEILDYSDDLLALEEQGFLTQSESNQAKKKMNEDREAYESAKLQHDSYVEHVFPMMVKKAEGALKKALVKRDEVIRAGKHKVSCSELSLKQARQVKTGLENQLINARNELAMTEIKAPAPGMVVLREDFRSGQKRKPRIGDQLIRNQILLELPDLGSMVVKTKIRELDLQKVEIGKPVTIEVDAYPQKTFTGQVIFIGVLAVFEPSKGGEEKYFDIKVAVNEKDLSLRPGMSARAVIHADKREDSLCVPVHAIFNKDHKNYCYVRTTEGPKKQEVNLIISNEQWAVVDSGLEEGAEVYLTQPEIE